ncbi:hypothetical protein ABS71_11230 [bacterium SCN 62-11]|nr:MAG: hypothetical protein ABS71_11230 [bacterium SCN 62-11]
MSDKVAWKALQLAFQQARPDQLNHISFFGGEPLLHFEKMVCWTRLIWRWRQKTGYPVALQMTSNATLLNDSVLHFLAHYRFQVAFSVDGLGENHDRHRPFTSGRPSSQVVWRNLARAAPRLPDATIQMVLNPDTVAGVPEALTELRRLGYSRISLLPNMEADWSGVSQERLQTVYRAWRPPLPQADLPCETSASLRRCGFGHSEIAVAPSGTLYPCARLVGADQRQSIQCGHVARGIDREKLRKIGERARVKDAAVGISGGCGCITFMPGDLLHQLNNVRAFANLEKAPMTKLAKHIE